MTTISPPTKRSLHSKLAISLWLILAGLVVAFFANRQESSTTATTTISPPSSSMNAPSTIPELLRYELVLTEENPRLVRYIAQEKRADGSFQNVTVHRWMSLLMQSNPLISQFLQILRDSDMPAFFFETKGVTYQTSQTVPFEFVLVESQHLFRFADAQQDESDFREHLSQCGNDAVGCVFPNLGGDSILIAPTKKDSTNTNVYGHLGAFLRRAPSEQVVPFWKLSLETLWKTLQQNETKLYWFSTDGTGVNWLHMRIDPRPKYYDYRPFAQKVDGGRD